MQINQSALFSFLETWAPIPLQEDYDNSGLLITTGDTAITGVIVALDCTEAL